MGTQPNNTRVLFMGTPDFAVATLNALIADGVTVVGVVTAPDRPAGRGRQLRSSPVKQRALEAGIPVLQPERLRDPGFHAQLDELNASLYIVVAFRMLPASVWERPVLGTVNLHASLLPDYRGAAPINWAVINGEQRSGVSTFMISHDIDTGDLLMQRDLAIAPDETAGELHDRMMAVGAELIVETVHGLARRSLTPVPQDHASATHSAPKLDTDTCHIDFNRPAADVHNLIRGLSPFPGAWCTWKEQSGSSMHFKILRSRMTDMRCERASGAVRTENGTLHIACADNWLEALEVQPEGKRRMQAADFVRGLKEQSGITVS